MESIIQLTLGQVIAGASAFAILTSALLILLGKWFFERLSRSIQHDYDKKLEDYRFKQIQKQKAEMIGRLFAKWIKYGGETPRRIHGTDIFDHFEDLNRMSLEAAMWIEDKEILLQVMDLLSGQPSARDVRTITGNIRKLILNDHSNFNSQGIVLWKAEEFAAQSERYQAANGEEPRTRG